MHVQIEADFLSESYFSELSQQYTQIRSGHRKWYVFDHSKAIAAHAILTRMMHDFGNHSDILFEHMHSDLFFETFDQHVRQLPYITEKIHFFRNELNRYGNAPEQIDEMIKLAACGKWQLFSARYHRYEVTGFDAAYHVKFISANGRFEVVYNTENGLKISDAVNMGTYNYAPGSIIPWKYYQHHLYDKVPWMKWGNTDQISYKDIKKMQSRHGSPEQKQSTAEIQKLIKTKMSEKCQI
ncbi:hypothetical protein M3231_03825 [Neobacillus mesonae]|nr:hypothetical protein [Neobacillus mesonae]